VTALKGPDPTCYWKKLTEDELKEWHELIVRKFESGEIVTKRRKVRSDAGKKRGSKAKRIRDDSDKENDDDGLRKETNKHSKVRSTSIVVSDEESD
jgi:hypothetical protein